MSWPWPLRRGRHVRLGAPRQVELRPSSSEGWSSACRVLELQVPDRRRRARRARAPGGGERVTRAYTVEVQTASVFYAQSLILLLFEP